MNKRSLFPLTIILLTSVIAQGAVDTGAAAGKNLGATAKSAGLGDLSTGYFNSALAISESKLGKEIYQQIETRRQQCATDLKTRKDSYDQKARNYQAKATTLSVAAREKEERDLMELKENFENLAKKFDRELQLSMRQGQEKVYRDVQDAVYQYGRDKGFDLVMDAAQHFVINQDKVNEGTKAVVSIMDANYDKNVNLASADKDKNQPTA